MRVAPRIELAESERRELERLARSNTVSVRLARRVRIVLLAAEGKENGEIGRLLRIGRIQAGRWRDRYAQGGRAAIERDLPRGGRPRKVDADRIVQLTTQSKPENATHWSTRTLAAKVGVSDSSILRVWHRHGLKPHLVETKVDKRHVESAAGRLRDGVLEIADGGYAVAFGFQADGEGLPDVALIVDDQDIQRSAGRCRGGHGLPSGGTRPIIPHRSVPGVRNIVCTGLRYCMNSAALPFAKVERAGK